MLAYSVDVVSTNPVYCIIGRIIHTFTLSCYIENKSYDAERPLLIPLCFHQRFYVIMQNVTSAFQTMAYYGQYNVDMYLSKAKFHRDYDNHYHTDEYN